MPTLQDLLTLGGSTGGSPSPSNDRADYLNYAEACMTAGKQPLPFPDWVKAGKPPK